MDEIKVSDCIELLEIHFNSIIEFFEKAQEGNKDVNINYTYIKKDPEKYLNCLKIIKNKLIDR